MPRDLLAEVNGLSTPNLLAGLLILSALLNACMEPVYAPERGSLPGEFAPGAHPYGIDGTVNDEQALTVESLAWPQDHEAMTTLLGFPMHFSGSYDYYQYGDRWLVIRNDGPMAVGYHYEERR
ncbi:hypothetical protein IQ265_00745 [Nodosilinea sp. LEGE 06152]|uniref:hypothetical protein n=1 Tax=Nodosilinea sp. LEGE 06152 TaxID=2777966 RepID=UPI00187F6992|nr:hypothetical protein [Nodosilinea sp. LEGE 06152]MBE9155375.1 hypothetical protein [Nodosilinea sp. LEGE 06152]